MANDVIVKIKMQSVVGSAGFGIPLILEEYAATDVAFTEVKELAHLDELGVGEESEIYQQAKTLFAQENRPEKIAVMAVKGKGFIEILKDLKAKDFRQLIPVFGTTVNDAVPTALKALADHVETTDKIVLFVNMHDKDIEGIKGDHVFFIDYAGVSKGVEGAVVGATAGLEPGSFTFKNIILRGIEPDEKSDLDLEAASNKYTNGIVQKCGDVVLSDGLAASGEYMDVIDSKDWIIKNIAYKSQKLLNSMPKVTFDNIGISQLESVVVNVLAIADGMGMIAADDDGKAMYATNFATRSQCDAADIAKRHYKGGKFSFTLSGAIHTAEINGELQI